MISCMEKSSTVNLPNGSLVHEPAICSGCGTICVIGGVRLMYAYYVKGKEKYCRECAKKRKII